MKESGFNQKEILKIEKLQGSNDTSVFCSMCGGMITSLRLKGKEMLYFNEETFSNIEIS